MSDGAEPDNGLHGKVAIVTGSTKGIGLAIARGLYEAGASVVLSGRATALPDHLSGPWSGAGQPHYFSGDLNQPSGPPDIVDAALSAFGRLDILVNNAALQHFGGLSVVSRDDLMASLETNVATLSRLMHEAAGAMDADGGAIVNIASTRALRPGAGMAAYSASKAAVVSLTRSAAAEFGTRGIRVNAVSPGLVNRPGLKDDWPEGVAAFEKSAPLGRVGEPEDIADACLFLAGPHAAWITGHNLVVDGGVTLMR